MDAKVDVCKVFIKLGMCLEPDGAEVWLHVCCKMLVPTLVEIGGRHIGENYLLITLRINIAQNNNKKVYLLFLTCTMFVFSCYTIYLDIFQCKITVY